MNKRSSSNSPFPQFEICRVSSTTKRRHSDSPTSSILKTPTAIFVTTRSSSAKRLKFANGPVDLQSLKNSSENYSESVDSAIGSPENNGEVISEDSTIEVAVSPVKTMQVSPDSWKAFLEYKKYNDYANETEKTDYTYSRLSKFRHKEIIPGFLIRPNLSRASISSVSGKSSISLPSDQSFNESFLSYDFKTENSPIDEFKYNYKTPNAVHRTSGSRSKYYLRSAGDVDSEEIDTKSHLTESQYLSDSGTEPVVKKTHMYMTGSPVLTGKSHTNYHYLTKTRSLDLDDADLDEVDDDSAIFHGINNQSNEWLEKRKMGEARMSSSASSIAKNSNFFEKISAFFLIFTMIGNKSRDLFSRYILRKGDSSSYNDLGYLSGSRYEPSYMSEKNYASPYYNSVRYYGSQKSWHQRFLSNFSEMFSKMYNFTWGSGSPYTSYNVYGHQKGTQKRKWSLWWLLIPFLILTGSFLGYIDFFSNPKAVLNTIYNFLLFFPSFLHYTVTVFVPRLLLEIVPHFFTVLIPNLVTVTLPALVTAAVRYLWELIYFVMSLSPAKVWSEILAVPRVLYNLAAYFGKVLFIWTMDVFLLSYDHTSNYLMLFYSYFCTYSFDLVTRALRWVWNLFGVVFFPVGKS